MKSDRTVPVLLVSAAILFVLEIVRPDYTADPVQNEILHVIFTRTAGGVLFLFLISASHTPVLRFRTSASPNGRAWFCLLPALLIAVNNFPILGLLTGSVRLNLSSADWILLTAQSLAVGLFEELTFRAFLFPLVLQKFRGKNIFLATVVSSAVFAAVHAVNLANGILPVLMQIGYSFLIGGMCAVLLLKTRCIWFCVLIHALYNFGGTLVPTFGTGTVWDPVTVAVTAVLGFTILLYFLHLLNSISMEEAESILPPP